MINSVKFVDDRERIVLVNNRHYTPWPSLNDELKEWVDSGGIPEPAYTDNEKLGILRREKGEELKREALSRMGAVISAFENKGVVELMVELWPMLDTTKATPSILLVKDIYTFYRNTRNTLKTATKAQMTKTVIKDLNWPT